MYIAIVSCVTLFISSKRFWARLHAICLEKALYKLNIIIIIIIIINACNDTGEPAVVTKNAVVTLTFDLRSWNIDEV